MLLLLLWHLLVAAAVSGRAKRRAVESLPDTQWMSDAQLADEIHALMAADEKSARRWACDRPNCDGLPHPGWLHNHARASQRIPRWAWSVWMLLTGRGWGKTRTAAETVREWARTPGTHIAVIAKKDTLVREICFESPKSGLLAVIPPEETRTYHGTPGAIELTLKNGSVIRGFGAEVPDNLRGWAFDKGWCDEFASWNRRTAQATYDMLWFCLREAPEPQVIISTTPKPLPHVKKIYKKGRAEEQRAREVLERGEDPPPPSVVMVRGHMRENQANLSQVALEELEDSYGGTTLGKQELAGELLEDVDGALWQRWMFEVEDFRIPDRTAVPPIQRMTVNVDPAVTSLEDADLTGFTVTGRSFPFDATYADQRPRGYVFHAEHARHTPRKAMQRAAELYHQYQADVVVIEANNGGEYLPALLESVDPTVQWRIVHATRDKRARAAPAAALYEQARVHHVGPPRLFADLEDQMATYVGAPESEEKSPDLLDSLVWGLTDLFLDPNAPHATGGTLRTNDERLTGRR